MAVSVRCVRCVQVPETGRRLPMTANSQDTRAARLPRRFPRRAGAQSGAQLEPVPQSLRIRALAAGESPTLTPSISILTASR